MRIAIAKPDWGFRGGFEFVIARMIEHLERDGHDVRLLDPKVSDVARRISGVDTQDGSADFYRYAALLEEFTWLDARRADLLVSTQPPSFATGHQRHLSLFFHHQRVYYDLASVTERAGLVDPRWHAEATALIRAMDQVHLDRVDYFLAGSETVRDRLQIYNGIETNVGIFHAGMGFQGTLPSPRGDDRFDYPLLVSRHEFPKRTELFVHALKMLPDVRGVAVGAGGRLGYVQQLDESLSAPDADPTLVDSEPLWLCDAPYIAPRESATLGTNVLFEGHVSDQTLECHLRAASCVVAPALLEDYGLTVIEGMAYGKPAIVCDDGGNLANLVDDGVNGFVVAPTGEAIAAAITRLRDEPELARKMGAAARESASAYTWDRAMTEVRAAIEVVMA
jgi:glycosyltransferase involved in cell wall biosynthesis